MLQKKKNILAFSVMSIFLSLGMFFIYVPTTSAAFGSLQDALVECDQRVRKARCVQEVRKCEQKPEAQRVACRRTAVNNVAVSGPKVLAGCRNFTDPTPQSCHTTISEKCNGTTNRTCVSEELGKLRVAAGVGAAADQSPVALSPEGDEKQFKCGAPPNQIETRFNLGCKGEGSPIADMLFSFIRFLTVGVGLLLTVSMILAGIQYATSGGNAEETQKAKNRIRETIIALIFYLLISALAQYLIPGGLF